MKILLKNILSVIVLIILSFALYEIIKIGVLPEKYLVVTIVLEIGLFLFGLLFYNLKKKGLIILGILIYTISILFNGIGYYYLSKTNSYIDKNFSVTETYTEKTMYYVVTTALNPINDIKELNNKEKIEYYKFSKSIKKALKELGDYTYIPSDTAITSLTNVSLNNSYFLISKANYEYLMDATNLINKDSYKVIYEFEVEEKFKKNNELKDTYNIYLNGVDFTGIMRDYNLILTVNTKTRKIVMTSIPRDYYIEVPAYGMSDTLMCLGSIDSDVSKEALEKLFDIKIDYTVNLYTDSLVKVVDTLGGIDFCSEYDFYTTHALVNGTYDDTVGKKLHVTKGCKSYNGIEILTIARERNAFPGRDRYRQKNCRQILITIAKKLANFTTLTNYSKTLESFDGLYTTDLNDKVIKQLVKSAITNSNYEIIEQSVDGHDQIGVGHLGTQEAWTTVPDMNTVNAASNVIKETLR